MDVHNPDSSDFIEQVYIPDGQIKTEEKVNSQIELSHQDSGKLPKMLSEQRLKPIIFDHGLQNELNTMSLKYSQYQKEMQLKENEYKLKINMITEEK